MLDYLVGLAGRLGQWGYVLIGLGAALESAAFLGLVVPGESLVLLAGFLAAQGVFELDILIIIVALGAAVGDSIGYELGRRLGRPWAEHYGRRVGLTHARLERAEGFFSRHGGKSVFFGRFVGFARALVPFIAGSARMSYPAFLGYNLLGASLWSATVVLVGYFLGQTATRSLGRASAVLGVTLLLVLLGVLAGRWALEHEQQLRAWWHRFAAHPRVARLLGRFEPQIDWIKQRLSPGGYLGLQLTLGVTVFAGAAWLFGGIVEDIIHQDPLTVYDRRIADWFTAHQNPAVTNLMEAVSRLHEWPVILSAAGIFMLYLAGRRQWQWLLITFCTVPGGLLLNSLFKLIFHRAGLSFSGLAGTLSTYTFPSGHTMAATVFWGTLAAFLATRLQTWQRRVVAVLAAVFIVVLVAESRVYLGVYFLSDVLAAAAEGLAWLALCITAVGAYWRRRSENHRA